MIVLQVLVLSATASGLLFLAIGCATLVNNALWFLALKMLDRTPRAKTQPTEVGAQPIEITKA